MVIVSCCCSANDFTPKLIPARAKIPIIAKVKYFSGTLASNLINPLATKANAAAKTAPTIKALLLLV